MTSPALSTELKIDANGYSPHQYSYTPSGFSREFQSFAMSYLELEATQLQAHKFISELNLAIAKKANEKAQALMASLSEAQLKKALKAENRSLTRWRPLHVAVIFNNIQMVLHLLQKCAASPLEPDAANAFPGDYADLLEDFQMLCVLAQHKGPIHNHLRLKQMMYGIFDKTKPDSTVYSQTMDSFVPYFRPSRALEVQAKGWQMLAKFAIQAKGERVALQYIRKLSEQLICFTGNPNDLTLLNRCILHKKMLKFHSEVKASVQRFAEQFVRSQTAKQLYADAWQNFPKGIEITFEENGNALEASTQFKGDTATIILPRSDQSSMVDNLCALLFEYARAALYPHLHLLNQERDHGDFDRETYVKKAFYFDLQAARLLRQAIKDGKYTSGWPEEMLLSQRCFVSLARQSGAKALATYLSEQHFESHRQASAARWEQFGRVAYERARSSPSSASTTTAVPSLSFEVKSLAEEAQQKLMQCNKAKALFKRVAAAAKKRPRLTSERQPFELLNVPLWDPQATDLEAVDAKLQEQLYRMLQESYSGKTLQLMPEVVAGKVDCNGYIRQIIHSYHLVMQEYYAIINEGVSKCGWDKRLLRPPKAFGEFHPGQQTFDRLYAFCLKEAKLALWIGSLKMQWEATRSIATSFPPVATDTKSASKKKQGKK